jgi:hypothetical protein
MTCSEHSGLYHLPRILAKVIIVCETARKGTGGYSKVDPGQAIRFLGDWFLPVVPGR